MSKRAGEARCRPGTNGATSAIACDSDSGAEPAQTRLQQLLRLDRREHAAAAAAEFSSAAESKGQPWALARAARSRGLLAHGTDAESCCTEALRLHELTPDAFETARTRLAYGASLRRARKRIRAREQLRAPLEVFERLGAESWADQASAELAATGETARRRDPSTLDDLTPQELQIARLLAAGKTTCEAAAAIFLSPKTVEYHLRHVYGKLGIHSREELIAAFGRPPGGDSAPPTRPRAPPLQLPRAALATRW